jgi:glycosyltransferase involved in cell wall biosynthesis
MVAPKYSRALGVTLEHMQAPPLFSIILPTYNRAALLGRALSSVLAQDESSWELLVGDDGSTDKTWPLLCDWQARDHRVRCWRHENRGQSITRNRLLAQARAPWIAFLDSDDEFEPMHLSRRREVIESSTEVAMWISPMRIVGSPLVPCKHHPEHMIHVDRCVGVGMIVVRREAILAVGGFPEIGYAEDSAMVKRLVVAGVRTRRLEARSYIYYRDHADTITQNFGNPPDPISERLLT